MTDKVVTPATMKGMLVLFASDANLDLVVSSQPVLLPQKIPPLKPSYIFLVSVCTGTKYHTKASHTYSTSGGYQFGSFIKVQSPHQFLLVAETKTDGDATPATIQEDDELDVAPTLRFLKSTTIIANPSFVSSSQYWCQIPKDPKQPMLSKMQHKQYQTGCLLLSKTIIYNVLKLER